MTLKARKSSHRNNRVGWTRVKTGHSRGWGLPRKWPSLHRKTVKSLFSKKTFAFGTIALIILGILYAIPSDPLFHSYVAGTDPTTFLWSETAPNNNLADFNSVNAIYTTVTRGGFTYPSIQLNANTTFAGLAETRTPVDLSTVSGKALLSLFMYTASTGNPTGSPIVWGMFLTTNNTLPLTANYNPFNDKNVGLLTKIIPLGANAFQYNLEFQRKDGNAISTDDTGSCQPSSSACFLSMTYTRDPTTTVTLPSFALNYTGTTNSGTCGANGNGSGCSFVVEYGGLTGTSTQILPSFNFQAKSWYVGFYVLASTIPIQVAFQFDRSTQGATCILVASQGCMEMDLYIPNPTGVNTPPNIDTGGFFGPLVRALINIGVFVLQSVENYLGFLAIVIKIGLNSLGSFFGWGNIGDVFINTVNGIITTIAAAGAAVVSFLANLVARGLDLLNIATTFSSVFFTGIQKFLSEMSTITGGIVTIFSKLFLYGGAFYFLYDLILYFQLTGDAGFEGIGTWIGFNKWAAFSVFGLLTRILNALINAFDWLLSHIPTIGAKMPENGFPGIPQLSAGEFPGLRIPTGHVAKLREGDPAAFFLWAVGGFLILPFYLGSAISPLAGLTAAVGCNPTTCFNNMLTTVGYPFAGLFIIIFVGVTITEILHGITDVGGQRIVIQNKLPAGFRRFEKGAKGEFSFGTGKFAQFKKGHAKQSRNKAVERQETISREQAYENRHGSSVFE